MDQNNVKKGPQDMDGDYDGFESQAHADHHTIMKAHEVIKNPERMEGVRQLHQQSGGLINYLKAKRKEFETKEQQEKAAADHQPAHEETPAADHDANMAPTPLETNVGRKQSYQVK